MTVQQFNVLRILKGRHPEFAYMGEIKGKMVDKSPDLTRLMDRLLEKGWIKRSNCPENRRNVMVWISQKGIKNLIKSNKQVDLIVNEISNKLSEKEAETLSKLLDKIRN